MGRNTHLDIEQYRDLSNHEGIVYTFLSERGRQDISYAEYLADIDLRAMVNDTSRYRFVLGRSVFTYSHKYLREHKNIVAMLRELEEAKRKNPLRFFAPNGHEMTAFLNDYENSLCLLVAPNRAGKTQHVLVKKLLNNIPCDPNWEIFTKYGVKYRHFMGPSNVGLSTYDFGFHRDTTLPMLLDWIPEKELGRYAKEYKGKGAKQVSLRNEPMLPLECGTRFYMAATSQGQNPFEGNVKRDWMFDEQGSEANFDGADERTRTIVDGRHDFGLTPHVIDGRPDTGAGSWINRIWDGEIDKGHSIGRYKAMVWDSPDWIYPEESKVKAFRKWVIEPEELQDVKKQREGRARFFGDWHESSGLVIDEWDSTRHVIEPFSIPEHWTRVRAIDHGTKHPAAMCAGAVSPAGDLFIYLDYRRTGRVVSQICSDIIELCGNKRKKIGTYRNPRTDGMYDRFEEIPVSQAFAWTVFDPRAFKKRSDHDNMQLSQLYALNGIRLKQGSGADSDTYVPILKEWFVLDPNKKHFVTGEPGAPRIYIFNTCQDLIRTIRKWKWEERKSRGDSPLKKSSPSKKDDDLCDCLKYMIQANPRFIGSPNLGDRGFYGDIDDFEDEQRIDIGKPLDPLTRY